MWQSRSQSASALNTPLALLSALGTHTVKRARTRATGAGRAAGEREAEGRRDVGAVDPIEIEGETRQTRHAERSPLRPSLTHGPPCAHRDTPVRRSAVKCASLGIKRHCRQDLVAKPQPIV